MPELRITVRSDEPIPPDVLVEHIAVALRDFRFAGKVDVQMTSPFANPSNVAFDDDVQLEPYTGPHADDDLGHPSFHPGGYTGPGRYPLVGTMRKGEDVIPKAHLHVEGLTADDLPADPYPFVTRWLDQLRGRRRD